MSNIDDGWFPIRTAPKKEVVYVGTPKMKVLAYQDERGNWRRKVNNGYLNWQVKQWQPKD